MTESTDHSSPGTGSSDSDLDEFRTLVRAAFEQAQSKGKPDWEEMTSAVLKNRLLGMTEKQFSESRYGSPSFIHLVRRVPDLLEVVNDTPPYKLRIKPPAATISDEDTGLLSEEQTAPRDEGRGITSPANDWRRVRVRGDLWRAIIDYSSGENYVFDLDIGRARPKQVTDVDLPEAPTATREELSSWRHEFAESLPPSLSAQFAEDLGMWIDHGGRQTDLPRRIRGQWVEFVKMKVGNKLNEWFNTLGIPSPTDMLLTVETGGISSGGAIEEVIRARQLRELIIRALRAMTYEELTNISLPASALLRVTGHSQGQNE